MKDGLNYLSLNDIVLTYPNCVISTKLFLENIFSETRVWCEVSKLKVIIKCIYENPKDNTENNIDYHWRLARTLWYCWDSAWI